MSLQTAPQVRLHLSLASILFDESDSRLLAGMLWRKHSDGYAVAALYVPKDPSLPVSHSNRVHRIIRMHRLIMGASDDSEVDHINGNKIDNRRSNLRLATRSQNSMNTSLRLDSTSGVKGVHYDKSRGKWMAYIKRDGVRFQLGRYPTLHEATIARSAAEMVAHGNFSRK